MSEKKSLEEQMSKLTLANNIWIEPMRKWITQATSICEIAKTAEPSAIKSAFLEMDGLNLFLKTKKAQPTAAPKVSPPSENIWFLLCKTKEKAALAGDNLGFNPFLVQMRGLEPPRP